MYYRNRSHHNRGDFSCSRHFLQKLSVRVTRNRQSAFCILLDKTYRMYYTNGNNGKTGYLSRLRKFSENPVSQVTHDGDNGFLFDTAKTWRMQYRSRNHRKSLEYRILQWLSLESAFYVNTAIKLTQCTIDIEVIIKQVIWASPDKFWKIKFSSKP